MIALMMPASVMAQTSPQPVDLGTSGDYVILASTGISTTGTTSIVGDIGVSPNSASSITGFGLTLDASGQYATSSLITGKAFASDYAVPAPTKLTTAVSDMGTAYTDAAGRTPDYNELHTGNLTGQTLTRGVYKWSTAVQVGAGGVTISGSSTDVWIFVIAQDLTLANGAAINLSGGAQASNIFWQVAGAVTLGTTSDFSGIILCKTQIAMQTGAAFNGRALAQTAVTLDATSITYSLCTATKSTDTEVACNSYKWIDGNSYTSNNTTATHTLTNAAGCDSVVTLNLTINNSTSGTDVITACDSFTWIDGNTYTDSNSTATHTLTNAAGCDSVVTLNLTINNSTTGTDVITACGSYRWIDGNTYTSNNTTATDTLTNAAGCDSVVTLNLTINTVSDLTTTTSGITLSATNTSATYAWLNCDNNYAVITGETNQSYTATSNGNYAVELTENGCVDTSACAAITSVGITENHFGNELSVYPNPTGGNFSIDLGENYESASVRVTDINGKLIQSNSYNGRQFLDLKLEVPAGVYLLVIESEQKRTVIRLVKE